MGSVKAFKPLNLLIKLAVRSAVERYDLEAENRRLLLTVKRQAGELRSLELNHPGITRVQRTERGVLVIPEIGAEELERIIDECARECA